MHSRWNYKTCVSWWHAVKVQTSTSEWKLEFPQTTTTLFDSRRCHWNFSLTRSFQPHYGLGFNSASNRNKYQVCFLGSKGGRCIELTTLPPSCANWLKSGSLNLLKPSGPVQACNGIALPMPLTSHTWVASSVA